MKKLLLILLIPLLLCSCKESEQIDEIAFAKIISIDKSENGFLVTAGIQLPKPKDKEQNESKDFVSVECETLSQGFNKLEEATDKKMFFGQISCVLLGEKMAREGIIDTVDYLVRSDELRFDIPVIVVKGENAHKIIENGSGAENHISEKITKLLESNYSTSSSGQVELSQLVEMLEDPFRSPYLPYMVSGKEKGEFFIEGYCVFEKDRLLEFCDEETSLGINFINSDVENLVLIGKIEDKTVTLKVTDFKSKIKLKDGIFKINIDFQTEVIQADSSIEKFDQQLVEKIVAFQNGEIERITEKTLKYLKEKQCDVATFGDTFHNVSPKKAEKYIGTWGETFERITYEISVKSKLDPSKTSGKPVKQGGD